MSGELAGLCHPVAAADGLFSAASAASHAILGALGEHFGLRGRAKASLGTALRVKAVRAQLGIDAELLQTLGYVSAAADAARHLTAPLIGRVVEDLRSLLRATGESPRTSSSEAGATSTTSLSSTSLGSSSSAGAT